jgi:hypothetical protein
MDSWLIDPVTPWTPEASWREIVTGESLASRRAVTWAHSVGSAIRIGVFGRWRCSSAPPWAATAE